jgi:hypothetical protein
MKVLSRWSVLFACALSPTLAHAATTSPIDPALLDLKIAPGAGAAVQADANLNAAFSELQSSLHVSVGADPRLSNDPFQPLAAPTATREVVGLNADWAAPALGRLSLALSEAFDQSWRGAALGLVDLHQVNTEDRGVSTGLTMQPLRAVELSLSASAAQKNVLDVASIQAAIPEPHSQFSTASENLVAGIKWRPLTGFSLEADGRLETVAAAWRGAPAGTALTGSQVAYTDFQPTVTGVLDLPHGGRLGLSFGHAVAPIDTGVFAAFAAVEDRASAARIGPNREWRYQIHYDQKLAGDMRLSASLLQARIESATELGPVGPDLQAPISVAGGERQEADVSLAAPLTLFGLPSFTLNGAGAWRSSQVRDPFTGELRRASAETPQNATLGLSQSLGGGARWGLEGRFGGDQSLYQMSQVTQINVADSLGGFVEYAPGPLALRLQIDGLYGGERTSTDLYYVGARGVGALDRVDRHTDDGQAVRLILSKAL